MIANHDRCADEKSHFGIAAGVFDLALVEDLGVALDVVVGPAGVWAKSEVDHGDPVLFVGFDVAGVQRR